MRMKDLSQDRDEQDAFKPNGGRQDGSHPPVRVLGIDIGAETIKVAELRAAARNRWVCHRRELIDHHKEPATVLLKVLQDWEWDGVASAAITGRFGGQIRLPQVPTKQAQAHGARFFHPQDPCTIVSIGSHGFSVLELRDNGIEVFRENSRCSQGTGNFLRQLVERFGLNIEEASALSAAADISAPLSGRCPVILKTDMTHLANKGENRSHILAGLFDAVCENVLVLVKPGLSPSPVTLIGGVGRSERVQRAFKLWLQKNEMEFRPVEADDGLFFEAIGAALVAAENRRTPPALEDLPAPAKEAALEWFPGLSLSMDKVKRMNGKPLAPVVATTETILGFDIGSTGSKMVALDARTQEPVWQGYMRTGGSPVMAAQSLLQQYVDGPAGRCPIRSLAVTGSGREIVGSMMASCYGKESVFVLNEIAAHAQGAMHYDSRVDTIFEIGGQDAKYIRLAGGRVVDCAMNEACSAGTGSFIEEQGRKFAGIQDVAHLGREALSAGQGISLGQHCSVFMAEVIDQAAAAGVDNRSIIAGLYDSVIQNYLFRVKGSRSVGDVVFCQGMPFASDALAAAVARLTGSEVVVPPDPGTVGALGIALLAAKETTLSQPLDPQVFLNAKVERKETFVCKSTVGCGTPGNRCRIDSLHTIAEGRKQTFNWGGGCSLYDKGARRRKLPDRAPDPFREREELVRDIIARHVRKGNTSKILVPDEFMMKGFLAFFSVYLSELGLDVELCSGNSQEVLKRGIQGANVPYCAPMQLFHGLCSQMAESDAPYIFLPMLRSVTRVDEEPLSVTCPIVQASPDLMKWDLPESERSRIISPVINIGVKNLESPEFLNSCRQLAGMFGREDVWETALARARKAQEEFEKGCGEIGRRSLEYCRERDITPVIVLGRPYTIYNKVLNSNVPAIVREQGAIAIPVDCYAIDSGTPVFETIYWGYGQRILRAARQVRMTPGHYSVYCSNYSCGPDGFLLHFYSYMMEGKPFSIIETDGHSGDAGTKTRIEAFLHCVREDKTVATRKEPKDFLQTGRHPFGLASIRQQKERLLVPWMGPGSEVLAAAMRGMGIPAEALPMPDREALRLGRRYTSGKECLPMCLTLGGLLKRLEEEKDKAKRFAFVMPRTNGPCRLGAYHLLDQIVFERAELKDRVRVWAPVETGYFDGTPPGFAMLTFVGFAVSDMLLAALFDTRPVETEPGAANAIYSRYQKELTDLVEKQARGDLSLVSSLWAVANGGLYGLAALLRRAAAEFASIRGGAKLPTVLLVGEIYVRCDDFANDFVIDKLEQRGLKVRLAPFTEFFEYLEYLNGKRTRGWQMGRRLSSYAQVRVHDITWDIMAKAMGWSHRHGVRETLDSAAEFIREDLLGEAVLTLGAPIHLWEMGQIDAVVSVGPLECLPNKISEAQFYHAAEKNGLLNLTLSLNGEPADPETLNNFAFEVQARFQKRQSDRDSQPGMPGPGAWKSAPAVGAHASECGHCQSCSSRDGAHVCPPEPVS